MASIPRIMIVDPTGSNLGLQVQGVLDLMDRIASKFDMPSATHALDELKRAPYDVVVSVWDLGDEMAGWELAAEIKRTAEKTSVIVIADYDDTPLDNETIEASPFVYFQRPFDVKKFVRVLAAALDGEDVFAAVKESAVGATKARFGPVPAIDVNRAQDVIDTLLRDLSAMAIILATRDGQVLLERGTVGPIDRDELTEILIPSMTANINMRDIVGGNATSLQFVDGDQTDVFVLSVGLHHFMYIIFDGASGARQFGAVNRFGRRAAEDLIAILGAEAWLMRPAVMEQKEPEEARATRRPTRKPKKEEEEVIELARAEGFEDTMLQAPEGFHEALAQAQKQKDVEPIADIDPELLFGEEFDVDDDLFDLSEIEEIARDVGDDKSGKLTEAQARELGLLK